MNKNQAKTQLKRILADYRIGGNIESVKAKALRDAVYFAHEHKLELPPDIEGIMLVKVLRLEIKKEEENKQKHSRSVAKEDSQTTTKRKKPTTLDMMRGATKRPRMTVPQVLKAIGITWSEEEAKSILESVFGKDGEAIDYKGFVKRELSERDYKDPDHDKRPRKKDFLYPIYRLERSGSDFFVDVYQRSDGRLFALRKGGNSVAVDNEQVIVDWADNFFRAEKESAKTTKKQAPKKKAGKDADAPNQDASEKPWKSEGQRNDVINKNIHEAAKKYNVEESALHLFLEKSAQAGIIAYSDLPELNPDDWKDRRKKEIKLVYDLLPSLEFVLPKEKLIRAKGSYIQEIVLPPRDDPSRKKTAILRFRVEATEEEKRKQRALVEDFQDGYLFHSFLHNTEKLLQKQEEDYNIDDVDTFFDGYFGSFDNQGAKGFFWKGKKNIAFVYAPNIQSQGSFRLELLSRSFYGHYLLYKDRESSSWANNILPHKWLFRRVVFEDEADLDRKVKEIAKEPERFAKERYFIRKVLHKLVDLPFVENEVQEMEYFFLCNWFDRTYQRGLPHKIPHLGKHYDIRYAEPIVLDIFHHLWLRFGNKLGWSLIKEESNRRLRDEIAECLYAGHQGINPLRKEDSDQLQLRAHKILSHLKENYHKINEAIEEVIKEMPKDQIPEEMPNKEEKKGKKR